MPNATIYKKIPEDELFKGANCREFRSLSPDRCDRLSSKSQSKQSYCLKIIDSLVRK